MCSLMFKNAQKQGSVMNLRIAEVERAVRHETQSGNIVYVYKVCQAMCTDCCFVVFLSGTRHYPFILFIQVWQHETAGQFGSANLVLPEHHRDMIQEYLLKHRSSRCLLEEKKSLLRPLELLESSAFSRPWTRPLAPGRILSPCVLRRSSLRPPV